MGGLAWWHWLIIIAAFILLFGAKKLPDAARGMGRSLRILKSEVNAMHEDDDQREKKPAETDTTAQAATPAAQIAPVAVTPVGPVPVPQPPAAQMPVEQAPVQQPVAQAVPVPQTVTVPQAAPVPQTVPSDQYADPTRPAGS